MLIKVTTEDLLHASSQLLNGNSNIQSVLSTLQNLITSLGDGWQGQAYHQYQTYFAEWKQAATNLNEALSNLAQLTSKAAQNFQQSDQDISTMFRGQ